MRRTSEFNDRCPHPNLPPTKSGEGVYTLPTASGAETYVPFPGGVYTIPTASGEETYVPSPGFAGGGLGWGQRAQQLLNA